ncbi:MAG: PAS domain S-box protein, partial [Syntrophobacteraceae bacterium]|nr:PAS domain S-box protein [Syntrophobacteraceae bacterium]
MLKSFLGIYHSLISRLILLVGLTLFVSIFTWAYFNINYQKKSAIDGIVEEVDRLGNTIRLGTHYAMMLNSRDDINQIIKNVSRQEGIENVRIYNKLGQIKFSNVTNEMETITSIKAEACDICHKTDPPLEEVDIASRTRIFGSGEGYRLIGIISPIYNEPSCATDICHVHPEDKKVLGALDVVVSLQNTDKAIQSHEKRIILLAIVSFLGTSLIIGIFLLIFVNRPIKGLIAWTRIIGEGNYDHHEDSRRADEIGQLALAIDQMGQEIKRKQQELNRQRNEYQELFELVPCYITVQDRNLRLVRYNREFTSHFEPKPGDYCYRVYKGREERCDPCPVMKTFCDGNVHTSEEAGVNKDGEISHWVVHTSPIRDADGNILYVMETSLDTTKMKLLEEEIRRSEKKYRDIFNHIPNPVFVLDKKDLTILDCNDMATAIYGFNKSDLVRTSFLNLFEEADRERYARQLMSSDDLTHTRQKTKDGRTIFANLRISPSDYLGRDSLLVTTSDVTKRLLAEQHLIQASKMATLGEMATGIAHELNQPLSVIKTASSFVAKKVKKGELIREDILKTMAEEIDSHVDRASRIINHLREFGRKSEVKR